MGRPRVPVIALTGYLGAGKTTLLNHLLRAPGARLGVVVNDFGDINVDAALVTGEVDEPASVAGGCLCCMPDAGGLETALERLISARPDLDAILIEASGLAEPPNLVRLLRSAASRRVRYAGLIDVAGCTEAFPGARRMVVNVVAGQVHLEAERPTRDTRLGLVAIGARLGDDVRPRLEGALRPAERPPASAHVARLDRIRRRSRGI